MSVWSDKVQESSLVEEAERMISALSEQYLSWLKKDLDNFSQCLGKLDDAPEDAADILKDMFSICHNIKGQGAAFGYHMATDLGQLICSVVRNKTALSAAERDVVRQSLLALQLLVEEDIRGDGGNLGREILVRLQAMSLAA